MDISRLEQIRNRHPSLLGHESCFKTAVLLPLVEFEGEICVLFEVRSNDLRNQPGEICFPGGSIDVSDPAPLAAALRETREELGLNGDDIEYVAPLDILITPFNVIVYPYVGIIQDCRKIKPNASEVDQLLYVPLEYLAAYEPLTTHVGVQFEIPSDYPFHLIPGGREYPFRKGYYPQQFYIWQEHVIWGLTARILNHFINLLK